MASVICILFWFIIKKRTIGNSFKLTTHSNRQIYLEKRCEYSVAIRWRRWTGFETNSLPLKIIIGTFLGMMYPVYSCIIQVSNHWFAVCTNLPLNIDLANDQLGHSSPHPSHSSSFLGKWHYKESSYTSPFLSFHWSLGKESQYEDCTFPE